MTEERDQFTKNPGPVPKLLKIAYAAIVLWCLYYLVVMFSQHGISLYKNVP